MDVVNRWPICLPNGLDLTRDTDRIDHEKASWYCTRLCGLDYSNQAFTDPGAIIGPIQPFPGALERATFALDSRHPLFNEISSSDDLGAVPLTQQGGNG
jgi:hypothetical protein